MNDAAPPRAGDGRGGASADGLVARLFEPCSGAPPPEPEPPGQPASAALKTYRYLRVTMLVLVAALGISIFLDRLERHQILGSISAYYYTGVRSVFVGTMVAMGVALIAIKGETPFEDFFLNAAGFLAPIVAFVPTSPESAAGDGADTSVAALQFDPIANNVKSLLFAAALGLLVAVVLTATNTYLRKKPVQIEPGTGLGLALTGVLLVAVGLLYGRENTWFRDHAHIVSAFGMFGLLGVAALGTGVAMVLEIGRYDPVRAIDTTPARHRTAYGWTSIGIAGLMALGVLVYFAALQEARTGVFLLEAWEIGLFGAYWALQSVERWNRTA